MATALEHLERLAADLGERRACLDMRKHFCAYTKSPKGRSGQPGMSGGAALRNQLVHAETIAEYRRLVGAFVQVSATLSFIPPFPYTLRQ
jgi:tRNA-dihydrouridine synthase